MLLACCLLIFSSIFILYHHFQYLCKRKNQPFLIDFCICPVRLVRTEMSNGADGRTRTDMVSRSILSAVRLPISPHQHFNQITYLSYHKKNRLSIFF